MNRWQFAKNMDIFGIKRQIVYSYTWELLWMFVSEKKKKEEEDRRYKESVVTMKFYSKSFFSNFFNLYILFHRLQFSVLSKPLIC